MHCADSRARTDYPHSGGKSTIQILLRGHQMTADGLKLSMQSVLKLHEWYRIRTWHLFITLWHCLSSTRSCSCSSNGWLDEGVAWSDRPTVGWATCDGVRWVTGRWLLMHAETELVWCAVSSPTTTAWRRRSEWRRWLDVDMGSRKWGVQTLSTLSTNMEPVHHNTNSQLHNHGNWYAR